MIFIIDSTEKKIILFAMSAEEFYDMRFQQWHAIYKYRQGFFIKIKMCVARMQKKDALKSFARRKKSLTCLNLNLLTFSIFFIIKLMLNIKIFFLKKFAIKKEIIELQHKKDSLLGRIFYLSRDPFYPTTQSLTSS